MVLDNELYEPTQEVGRLVLAEPVDLLHVVADSKDGFPARDRVGTDDGMDSLEDLTNVLGCSALG